MHKSVRAVAALIVAIVVVFTTVESASAATYYWSSAKIPGYTDPLPDNIEMPLYKGTITFKLTRLTGSCSCLIARAESFNENYYYVNNSLRCCMLTAAGGKQEFKMSFTSSGLLQETMIIKCDLVHNAAIGDTISGEGNLYY